MQVEVGVHTQRVVNTTTELEDMTSEYVGLIGVGTARDGGPQFQARVVFDTGSTNLWVASVLCKLPPCTSASSSRFYDPKKSLTQEPFGSDEHRDIDIIFGTGELKGPLHVDTYRVGPMVVSKQSFAMIREMNGEVFSSFPFEGILGLAFPSLSIGGIEPFFEHVIKQKSLKNNEFAFYLSVDKEKPSALLWGGVDKSLFEGPIRMFPVVQPHYWSVELVDFRMGKESLAERGGDSRVRRAIFDTGTTFFTAPSSLHSTIISRMRPAPCREVESYEPLVFVLRGVDGELHELKVSQETYMVSDELQDCKPAFMQLDVSNKYGPAIILGEVFMRHFFTVFSRGNGGSKDARVGVARAKLGALPAAGRSRSSFLLQNAASLVRRGAA